MPSVSFDLVDASMMALLQDDAEAFMPSYDAAKGTAWNRRKASEALAAGIVAGDSVPALSKRLSAVTDAGRASAVRTARTYATAAQNAGRASTYAKAAASGVSLKVQWVATLDGRTRYSHRALDGEQIEEGGEFSNGLRYPGDPSGPAQEVYNCRCTTIAVVDGVDMSDAERSSRLGSSTYESWKAGKQAAATAAKSAPLSPAEAMKATNPNFSRASYEYSCNCQRCVVAYEANRRGVLCEAKPRIRHGDTIFDAGTAWNEAFADAAGNALKASHLWEKPGIRQASQWAARFDSIVKARGWDNVRGIIRVDWKSGGAHVFNFETVDGVVHYYDAQVGKEMALQDWLPYCKPTMTTFARVDDLEFTGNLDLCIERK